MVIIAAGFAFPSTLTLRRTIGLEFGIGFLGALCALVAIVLWVLTQNTAYTLSLLDMIDAASSAGTARENAAAPVVPPARQPNEGFAPIPIERGHQVRQQRAHRAG